jgi:hypothetical protein
VNPWGSGLSLVRVIQFAIIGVMFVALTILTYDAAKRIETGDEEAGP